ncbi:MAG TPA: hypothetical protein PLY23_02380 [Alphaproteobacteria bacterium]|nr:hypothetical protein [Alphaproteobacteria bacterium]HQS93497.1 hypothetical protein [Alphaproteobacteria bacterium]
MMMKNIIKTTLLMVTAALSFCLDASYAMDYAVDPDTEISVRSRLTLLDSCHVKYYQEQPQHFTGAYTQFTTLNVEEVVANARELEKALTHARKYPITGEKRDTPAYLNPAVNGFLIKNLYDPYYIIKSSAQIENCGGSDIPFGLDPFSKNSLAGIKLKEIADALRSFPTIDGRPYVSSFGDKDNLDVIARMACYTDGLKGPTYEQYPISH